jgi:bifunctional non-homologous end joining protein LigD
MRAAEQPCLPFTADDWIYELKHDGYRTIAAIAAEDAGSDNPVLDVAARIDLFTKSGANCSKWFPEVLKALHEIPGGPHVIDGEACVLRPDGTSDFNEFQQRARRRRWYPGAPLVTLCVFDLLVYNGQSVMERPLIERKALLKDLVSPAPKSRILFVGDLPADAKLFEAMVAAGLQFEGVVAKRKDSIYTPGVRSPHWLKIKRPGWQEGREWRS